jgi:hypothetical protein
MAHIKPAPPPPITATSQLIIDHKKKSGVSVHTIADIGAIMESTNPVVDTATALLFVQT